MPDSVNLDTYLGLVTSEHRGKPNFNSVLTAILQPAIDLQGLYDGFSFLFDIDNAIGDQLDKIGLWVGQTRFVKTALPNVFFTFDDAALGFDQGTWFGPGSQTSGLTALPDDAYRTLLRGVIAADHWDGTIPGAYEAYKIVFPPNMNQKKSIANQLLGAGDGSTVDFQSVVTANGTTSPVYLVDPASYRLYLEDWQNPVNWLTYSQDLTNAAWTKAAGVLVISRNNFRTFTLNGPSGSQPSGPFYCIVTKLVGATETAMTPELGPTQSGGTQYTVAVIPTALQSPSVADATAWRIYFGTTPGGENHYLEFTEAQVDSTGRLITILTAGTAGTPPAPGGAFPGDTAPDGSLTAQTVVYDGTVSGSGDKIHNQSSQFGGANVPWVYSVWLRCDAGQSFPVTLADGPNVNRVICNLTGDWQRFSLPVLGLDAITLEIVIRLTDGSALQFDMWGGQLEIGPGASTYVKTTSLRGIGRSEAYFSPRTNLALYSSDYSNAAWQKIASGTGTAPAVTSTTVNKPDGVSASIKRIALSRSTGTTVNDYSACVQTLSILTSGRFVISVWMKVAPGATAKVVELRESRGGVAKLCTVTQSWQRFSIVSDRPTGRPPRGDGPLTVGIWLRGSEPTTSGSCLITTWGFQVEESELTGPTRNIETTSTIISSQDATLSPLALVSLAVAPVVGSEIFADFDYYYYDQVQITDNQNMTMTVTLVGPPPDAVTLALFLGGYLALKPAGVSVTYATHA